MSARTRIALAAAVAALSLTVAVAPASAGKTGPNNENAKKCQKGGWDALFTSTGGSFNSEQACVSYGAQGGAFLGPFAGQSACEGLTVLSGEGAPPTFTINPNPLQWVCTYDSVSPGFDTSNFRRLFAACVFVGEFSQSGGPGTGSRYVFTCTLSSS